MIKFQCHAFFLSLDIKKVVTLSSYLDNWWRINFKICFWSTKAIDKTETCLITYYITFNHSLKQWVTRKKEGKDTNTKNWISQERKEFFRWNKNNFFIIIYGLSSGEKWKKSGHSLSFSFQHKLCFFHP